MRFNYLFLVFFAIASLLLLNSIHAGGPPSANITLTDANLNTTIYLTEDVNLGSNPVQFIYSGSSGANSYLDFNCNYFNFNSTTLSGFIYVASDINAIILNNCDANTNSYFIIIDGDADINYIIINDSNLEFGDSGLFISTHEDDFLKFYFDNVDANYLLFKDLNFNSTNFNSDNWPEDSLITLTNNSDINYILFEDSNISFNSGSLITLFSNTDSFLNINFNNVNLEDVPGDGPTDLFLIYDSNYDTLEVNNINPTYSQISLFTIIASDFNNINLFNSDINISSNIFGFLGYIDDTLDLNFFGSEIVRMANIFDDDSSVFVFDYDSESGLPQNNITNLSIYDLNLITDANVFDFRATNIESLIIIDSQIDFNTGFATLDDNSYVNSGAIYNNTFILNGPPSIFGSNFNADFNTALNLNSTTRLLNDDSNAIGGNLWLVNSINVCNMFDINDNNAPFGICDSDLNFDSHDGVGGIIDYLPLIEYNAPEYVDLIARTIDLNTYNMDANNTFDLNFYYSNLGPNIATDFNVICDALSYPSLDFAGQLFNREYTYGLDVDNNYVNFSIFADGSGTYYINCYLISNSELDVNSLNDSNLSLELTINVPSNNDNNNDNNNNNNTGGGGGGGGSSSKSEITKKITINDQNKDLGTANFSNSDNDGVDKVIIYYDENIAKEISLKLNTEPSLTSNDFKVILDQTVISYLQFTYSEDQANIKDVQIIFSLPKFKVKDPNTIKLARFNSGSWKYYDTTFVDKGTYYEFTANVPGFSYFAIVNYKEKIIIDENTDVNKDKNIVVDNNNINDKNTVVIKDENNVKDENNNYIADKNISEEKSELSIWYTFGIIGLVLAIIIIVYLYLHFKHKPKEPQYSFKQETKTPETITTL